MKKFLSLLLIFLISLSVCSQAFADNTFHYCLFYVGDLTYTNEGETHGIHGTCMYKYSNGSICGKTLTFHNENHKYSTQSVTKQPMRIGYQTYASVKCELCGATSSINVHNNNWMVTIPDDALISQINMPGSFNSGTKYSWDGAARLATQYESIPEQLSHGIRILHLELEANNSNWSNYNVTFDGYNLSTGEKSWGHWEELYFSDVAGYVNDFLNANPTETVVMLVQRDTDNDNQNSNIKNSLMAGLNRNRIDRNGVFSRFDAYRPGDPIPKLGDVRGKCVTLYYDELPLTYYADMDEQTAYDSLQFKNYTEGLAALAMRPYFSELQNYSLKNDTFRNEKLRYISNPGEPSVKLVTYDCYLNHHDSKHGYTFKTKSDRFITGVLQPNIKSYYEDDDARGHRIGWVLSMDTNIALNSAIISSNAIIGEKYEQPIDKSTEPINRSFPLTDWMSYMPDNALITRLNLPGTHDSGTKFMYNSITSNGGKCQDKTISDQLKNGARVLDIRLGVLDGKVGSKWRAMRINHGGYACYLDSDHSRWLTIQDVLEDVDSFLEKHPSETVIMLVTCDEQSDDDEKKVNEYIKEMKQYLNPDRTDSDRWSIEKRFPRSDFYPIEASVPTLGQVRGRCVILWDDHVEIPGRDLKGSYSDKYCLPAYEKVNWIRMAMDNFYLKEMQTFSNSDERFGDKILKCPYNPGDPTIRYVGYNANTMEWANPVGDGNIGEPHGPEYYFKEMKSFLESIKPREGKRVGWVAMDFPTETMVRNIINSNKVPTTAVRVDLGLDVNLFSIMLPTYSAQLVRTDAQGNIKEVVCEIPKTQWTHNESGYHITFRAYDELDVDGDMYYAVVFPDADFTSKLVKQDRNNRSVIKDASVHTIEFTATITAVDASIIIPATGDNAHPVLWTVLMLLAVSGLSILALRRRRSR